MTYKYTNKRIREAWLIVASSEQVLVELEKYGDGLKKYRYNSNYSRDEEFEKSLFARNDKLIDIGLAQYAGTNEVVVALYKKSLAKPTDHLQERYLSGLRIACLANEVVEPYFDFPDSVIGTDEFSCLIREGGDDELVTLLSNPHIEDEVLENLYKNLGVFASLSDERRRLLVELSIHNPSLITTTDYDEARYFGYRGIHEGIIELLSNSSTTEEWLNTLFSLVCQLDPFILEKYTSYDSATVLTILNRWSQVALSSGTKEADAEFSPNLSTTDRFRCQVAAMYNNYCSKDNFSLNDKLSYISSPDVALRCAYYGNARLTKQDMEAGYLRDGLAYLNAVLCNESVLYDPTLRKLLEERQLPDDWIDFYQRRCKQIRKRDKWHFDDKELTDFQRLDNRIVSITNTIKDVRYWLYMLFAFEVSFHFFSHFKDN